MHIISISFPPGTCTLRPAYTAGPLCHRHQKVQCPISSREVCTLDGSPHLVEKLLVIGCLEVASGGTEDISAHQQRDRGAILKVSYNKSWHLLELFPKRIQVHAQDTVVGYTLTGCTFNGNFRGLELLFLGDGVVAPVFVRNTGYLRARNNERPALHPLTSTSPSFLGPTKGVPSHPSPVTFTCSGGSCCLPIVALVTMGFSRLKAEPVRVWSLLKGS